ncbi:MAG: hypothetical protein K6G50_11270 [bacterium]|nr:hypothetical protein [bacterium]
MRRRRGNVLIMAVFISAFIFLLAAVLTAQNRQNILLSLGEDHRMRADNGAMAAMDFALHIMRTNPEWESLLPGRTGELENGGTWVINSIERSEAEPHIIYVKTTGSSGFISTERTRIIEEIKLSPFDDMVLFSLDQEGHLVCLDQSFKWRRMSTIPATPLFMTANEGPLFGIAGAEYPYSPKIIEDLEGHAEFGDFQPPTKEYSPFILRLDIDDKTIAWNKLEPVYKVPESGVPSAGDLINVTKAKMEGTSLIKYTGPKAEWYSLAGKAAAAEKKSLYAHALHHKYTGAEGIIDPNGYYTRTKKASYSCTNAVLKYENSSWHKFADPKEPKTVTEQNTPSLDSITIAEGNIYSVSKDGTQIIKAQDAGWQFHASCDKRCLFSYNNSPCFILKGEDDDGKEQINFSGSLNLWKGLRADIDQLALNEEQKKAIIHKSDESDESDEENEEDEETEEDEINILQRAEKLRAFPYLAYEDDGLPTSISDRPVSDNYNSAASCGEHLYCFVNLIQTKGKEAEEVTTYDTALVHYDGTSWQLWPNGMASFIKTYRDPLKTSVGALLPSALACARYEAFKQPSLNRYAIIMDI